ncbi:basic amino acid ABC transporter substrate-binding protein [Acidaminococcus timonensis]|uniref:basic amino acid ABC transporter substrate-binding protein n=1 Tax=Acidaminococcus timonensis TaxID=1871002 RepID=UPI00307EBE3D
MKKVMVLLCALMMVIGAAGCGSTSTKDAGKPAEKKELIVGTEPSFAPFEFPDKQSGEITGFDMDLIKAMGKRAGFAKVTVKGMGFDALIPALDAGNIDVAIAGMSITDARKQKVNFTDPYYESGLMAIVKKENTTIKSLDNLKGKTIAVQLGTTGAEAAGKIEGATVKTFDTSDTACLELKNGGADAVISDLPVLQYFLKQGGSAYAKAVGEPKKGDFYGIATAKKNKALCDKLNKALQDMKKDGEYQKIYDKWFK